MEEGEEFICDTSANECEVSYFKGRESLYKF